MLSKGKVKYIHSLEMKKYRNELNAFVAEGNKLVADMMFAFECEPAGCTCRVQAPGLVARRSRSFYLARFSFRRHTGPWKSRNHHTPCRLVRHRTYRLQPRHRRCLQSEDCAGHNGRTGTCKSPLHGTGRLPESPGGKTNSVVRYIPRRRKHVHKGIVGKRNHRDGERRERNTSANRKVD